MMYVGLFFLAVLVSADSEDIGEPMSLTANWTVVSSEASTAATICLGNINQERANNGKSAVADHSQVEQAAYNHNLHMLKNNCFEHQCAGEPPLGDRLTATGYRWSGVGEIIARGQRDCSAAVQAWMNSEGHKNIMLGNSVHVGCSGLTCSNCANSGPWWTCVFANPL